MANGAIIKYNMAEFIPCAGFSPICKDVLVHTEHCACTDAEINKMKPNKTRMWRIFFISARKVKVVQVTGSPRLPEINDLMG